MKKCILVGVGVGNIRFLNEEARTVLHSAPLVAGAERVLQVVMPLVQGDVLPSYDKNDIVRAFSAYAQTDAVPCAVCSGDTGFYSMALSLRQALESDGWQVETIPGLSCVQYFAAKLGQAWQQWHLVSAHGADCEMGIALSYASHTFFLTGGTVTVRSIAQFLLPYNDSVVLFVGSRLSYPDELIVQGTPKVILARTDYDERLSCVLVVRPFPLLPKGALPDAFFIRNTDIQPVVPMTKRFVRASVLSALSITDGETVWDIGAGTGAVTIDIAHTAHCAVYAVEENESACALIQANREKAGAVNVNIVCGHAPQVLTSLPAPDAVFVGGSGGCCTAILRCVLQKNANARMVVSCISIETLGEIQLIATEERMQIAVTQISVAQSKCAGAHHLMIAQNPVWIVTLQR